MRTVRRLCRGVAAKFDWLLQTYPELWHTVCLCVHTGVQGWQFRLLPGTGTRKAPSSTPRPLVQVQEGGPDSAWILRAQSGRSATTSSGAGMVHS